LSTDNWAAGVSADWSNAADWSGGLPSSATTATIGGAGSFLVTLFGVGSVGSLAINAAGANFYDAGALSVAGTLALQAGTLTLAYGAMNGGTLAIQGGIFVSNRGTLNGVSVQGTLNLTAPEASLFVTGGLNLAGVGGSGAGSIALTGAYASLDFLGSQTLTNATISLGATGSQPGQSGEATLALAQASLASMAATLTLGASLWLRGVAGQGAITLGNTGPGAGPNLPCALVNQGTITAGSVGETLTISGNGAFTNQGTIGVSNGATLQVATGVFSNTGTIVVSNATLSLGGTYATALLGSLGHITLSAGQVQVAGLAINTGTLAIGTGSSITASLGALALAGTIAGGTITDAGGGLNLSVGSGVLDGVTYAGTLNLASTGTVTLTDGSRVVTGPLAAAGTIIDTGAGSALLLEGSETLDHVAISLGSAGAASSIATTDAWLASTATTATIGAHATLVQAGANASLLALGWSSVPGLGLSDTLVNQGVITAAVAGGELVLGGYGTFLNQGSILVSGGDTLDVTVQQFANAGTLSIGAGATALLGQPGQIFAAAPSWSNAGLIAVAGGTLSLGGAFTTGQLGSITQTSGSVVLAGTLANAGATLTLGAGHISALSLVGTVSGGTIVDPGGALSIGAGTGALLDGASYQGTLVLGAGGFLRVRDGLVLTGAADIVGAGAVLDFQGSQTIAHAQILLGAAGQAAAIGLADNVGQAGATTLTLGAGLTITQSGALAAIGQTAAASQAGDRIVNAGTITAAVSGGTFTLGGPGFTNQGVIAVGAGDTLAIATTGFSNTGAINVSGGAVSIAGSLTLAQLGRVNITNGSVAVAGTLNLAGGTLALGQGTAMGRVALTGTIAGGTITDAGGGLTPGGGATLVGVTYDGTLDLSRPFAQMAIAGGITLGGQTGTRPGTILLTGAQARLVAASSETIDQTQILLGSVSQWYAGQRLAAPELAADPGVHLTLGAATTLTLTGGVGVLGDAALGQWNDSIVNLGAILAAIPGTLTLGSTFFTNQGNIAVSGGGVVLIGDAGFTNAGTLSVGAGSAALVNLFDWYAAPDAGAVPFTNNGLISLHGGLLQEQTANGLFPPVALVNSAGATIQGSGVVFAQIANSGTVDASGGVLLLTQPVLGNGLLQIEASSTLELGAACPISQTVHFASNTGTLKLDTPSNFTGTLANFGGGNTIDLPGQILTGVGLSSGTLVLSNATQNFRITGSAPFAGEVSAGHDAHGGATISLTPQSSGGSGSAGALVIGVAQPGMLFWASPFGDEFQGTGAELAGAHVSNWGVADSIDVTDLLSTHASLSFNQGVSQANLTLTDGTHTTSFSLAGTFTSGEFHLASDGHGGTILSTGH
jgi:hypothetical protein